VPPSAGRASPVPPPRRSRGTGRTRRSRRRRWGRRCRRTSLAMLDPSRWHAGSMSPGLIEQMKSDLTAAMKARDTVTTRTLRSALTAVLEASVSGTSARDLDDDEVLAVLKTQVKRRDEAAEAFRAAGRDESAAEEEAEREVLTRYLPAELDDAALGEI